MKATCVKQAVMKVCVGFKHLCLETGVVGHYQQLKCECKDQDGWFILGRHAAARPEINLNAL
jgi:hypothetical protein